MIFFLRIIDSGLLVTMLFWRTNSKNPKIPDLRSGAKQTALLFIYRYMRLTPAFLMVIVMDTIWLKWVPSREFVIDRIDADLDWVLPRPQTYVRQRSVSGRSVRSHNMPEILVAQYTLHPHLVSIQRVLYDLVVVFGQWYAVLCVVSHSDDHIDQVCHIIIAC